MIQSMTGMANLEIPQKNKTIQIDLKSYNHRFLDIKLRLPNEIRHLEESFKLIIKKNIGRGRIEGSLKIVSDSVDSGFRINEEILDQFKSLCDAFEAKFESSLQFSPESLLKYPGLITTEETAGNETDDAEIAKFFEESCKMLAAMRSKEGKMLKQILIDLMSDCEKKINAIESLKSTTLDAYKNRLKKNLLSLEISMDETDLRILQEIGFAIDRADISEEIDRFRSHITHFRQILSESEQPIGKKLDFLCQELNREVNTICSKSESSEITKIGIELKSQIESFREQIQNIQ